MRVYRVTAPIPAIVLCTGLTAPAAGAAPLMRESVSIAFQPGEFAAVSGKISTPHAVRVASAAPQTRIVLELQGMPQRELSFDLAPVTVGKGSALPAPVLPPHIASLEPSPTQVASRLRVNLSPELASNFDLFLYVSKAAHGPWAQRMYVFSKDKEGKFALLYDWRVSTGREKTELDSQGRPQESITPAGYYQLDPARIFASYHSSEWNEPMPHAMFFDWVRNGSKTGLAIHAASGEGIAQIGNRASAGCVRLSPENATTLFNLVSEHYAGKTPRFAFDRATQSSSNEGQLMRAKNGSLQFAKGYRVLVFIEDFSGERLATLD
jgi:hypothetical protein